MSTLLDDPPRCLQIRHRDADTKRAGSLFLYKGSEGAVWFRGFEENDGSLPALYLLSLFAKRLDVTRA